jgi:hypothetical protein
MFIEGKSTFQVNKSSALRCAILCEKCKTNHEVLVSTDLVGEDCFSDFTYYYDESHQIIRCLGCDTISFRKISSNSEDTDYDETTNQTISLVTELLFPHRGNDTHFLIKDTQILPFNIKRIYEETIKAINSNQPILTGMGIRSLLEAICKDKQAKGNSLFEKINDLVKMGILAAEGESTLHTLRNLGNDAVHEVKPHTPKQLSLAIDVCEHLLQGVYLLPYYAKETFK